MNSALWVDNHIHVSDQVGGRRVERLLDELLAVLDRADADLRFIISCDCPEFARMTRDPEAILAGNRLTHELVRQSGGRLFGSCVINPNFLDASLRAIETCFGQWGFVQLGEMLQYAMGYDMNSDACETIARRAVQLDLPIQVHISTDPPGEHNSSHGMKQLTDLFGLIDRVPEGKYILAHAVGWPRPMIEPYLDAIEERFGCLPRGIWVEIRDFNSPAMPAVLRRIPADRLLAGTDWTNRVGPPFLAYGMLFGFKRPEDNPYPPTIERMRGFLREAGADDAAIERIAWRNAAELFRLPL